MIPDNPDYYKSSENAIFWLFFSIFSVLLLGGAIRLWEINTTKPYFQYNASTVPIQLQKSIGIAPTFMASKNGSKYYPLDCKAGNRIKEENRIFFTSEEEAKKSGYERTVTC